MSMEKLFEVCTITFAVLNDVTVLLAFDWSVCFFFRNGTRNLKSTLVRTHVCMVVSFVDIHTVLKVMHMYIMFLFSAGLCDYLLLLHTFLL